MTILITGHEGMLGSVLLKDLRSKGHQVVEFNGDTTKKENWTRHLEEDFDTIIHLAAFAGVRPSFENPEGYYFNNVNSMQNAVEFCKKQTNPKFLYASSSNAKEWWLNPYAATKRMNEVQGKFIRSIGMRFHTIWPGRQDMLYQKLLKKEVTYINEDHYRDFVHVDDVVAAINTIINNYDQVIQIEGPVVDIGTGHQTPVSEVARVMGYEGEYVKDKSVGERKNTCANVEYLLQLGWTPKRNILNANSNNQ